MRVIRIKIKSSTGETRTRTREVTEDVFQSLLSKVDVQENGYTLTEMTELY